MVDNRVSTPRRGAGLPDARDVFSPQETTRPRNEYLTAISDNDADYCLILCTLPAGAVVPMHGHPDRETFYLLSGRLEALREDRWEELGPGDIFDVRDGTRHAWRNVSQAAASMICVTTTKLAKFLLNVSAPVDGASSPEAQAQRFFKLIQANGYWLASPEENLAVGLQINWNERQH